MTRAMEQVGAGLEKIVAGSLRRSPAGQGPVLAWALACGQAVAARTRAVDFAQGILRVEVPDAGWRVELQALAPQYLAVINRYVAESVRRIEFVIGEKAAGEGARATRDMKVTEKDVAYVADLGNLELTAEERTRMVRDLNSILGHIDSLNELDTTNVHPWRRCRTAMAWTSRSRAANALPTPAAKMFLKACASRCRMRWPWKMLRTRTERFSKCPKVIER